MELWPQIFPDETIIPLWLKISYSVFVSILVPVYWKKWGPANFLWFSDVALFGMLIAVWLESGLLASMMGIAVLLPETAWNLSYFIRLLTGKRLLSLTDYMFDSSRSLFLRALSLFHVFLPVLIVWMIWKLGFQERAFWYQVLLGWSVLLTTYLFTDPAENINMVFGPGSKPQTKINPMLYLMLVMLGFAMGIFLPTYLLLRIIF